MDSDGLSPPAGPLASQITTQYVALAAAERISHRAAQATSHRYLGRTYARLGRLDDAQTHLLRALGLFGDLGDQAGQGDIHRELCLGYAHHHLGDHAMAIRCYERALDLYRETGERYYEADTLSHIADSHGAVGDHDSARGTLRQALAIHDELGHRDSDKIRTKLMRL